MAQVKNVSIKICMGRLGWIAYSPRKLAALIAITSFVTSYPFASVAQTSPRSVNLIDRIPSTTPPPPQIDNAYTLGAGDRLRVDIFQVPQYSGEQEVLVNGTLNLPVVGSVVVEGMSLEQAAQAIASQYSRILRRPIVTLNLLTPRPLRVGIAGEVNRPGSYTLNREGSQFPTLTQVLETAGGIRQSADLHQVEIRRPQRVGREQLIRVDLWQFLQTGDLQYDVVVRDGDTIFIPTATSVNLAESPQLAAASFAAKQNAPINIAVVGEVFRPGPYTVAGTARTAQAGVPGGTGGSDTAPTVTRAIQVAGGIMPTADIRRIQIHRLTRTGPEQVIEVNLWQLLEGGDLRQDVILQDGDTISVPIAEKIDATEAARIASASFSPDTIKVNVVGEVVRPGIVEVPPNTSLNQAVLAAGGFNTRASRSSVDLIRLNVNGSVSRQRMRVDFAQGINDTSNPALRNNDVVVVGRSGLASFSDALGTATDPLGRFFSLFTLPLSFFRLF